MTLWFIHRVQFYVKTVYKILKKVKFRTKENPNNLNFSLKDFQGLGTQKLIQNVYKNSKTY